MRGAFVLGFVLTILMSVSAYASGTYAVVTGYRVNVRAYACRDSDNRLFQVNRGAVVEIYGIVGDFFVATVNGTSDVYISREFVRFSQTQGVIIAHFAWVYDFPGEGGTAITILPAGTEVTVISTHANWYGVEFNGTTAFIEQFAVEIPCFVELPAARIGSTLADTIVEMALGYIGTRYLWGGTTPNGFDCSGFMVYVFSQHGISLNRISRDQALNGTAVSRCELEPGDLVFFGRGRNINHVGMYIGGNQFIHSSSKRTGGVRIGSLNDSHSSRTFISANRVLV